MSGGTQCRIVHKWHVGGREELESVKGRAWGERPYLQFLFLRNLKFLIF